MKLAIYQMNGFITDGDFENLQNNFDRSANTIIVDCTKEINGDIAVAENYIASFKEKYQKLFQELKKNNRRVFLFLNTWYQQYRDIFEIPEIDEIVYIDAFLYSTYKKLIIEKQSPIVKNYKLNQKNKFLCLINKPANPHRIGLIYKLSQRNLLTESLYSFIIHNTFTYNQCRDVLKFLSDEEFDNFYSINKRSLDLDFNPNATEEVFHTHYTGIPYEYRLFADCNFQLISETHFDVTVWITEKTWISIVNKRPFIIAAYPGFLKRLRDIGFRTFKNYVPNSEYNDIPEYQIEDRLNAIVDNVEFWISNIHKYQAEISEDVNYNYQLFLKLAKENETKIHNFISKHNLSTDNSKFMRGYDNYQEQIWYNGFNEKEQE